ncbi:MAG: HAD-IB family phosphatase [Saprospiraceae bacterium]|nr:HAD-IB family phosphatase [Saprospiraceae bacterium]
MVTVIIPALNEQTTIGNVIQLCFKNSKVNEVIVVDDKSMDSTIESAINAGAKVVTSTKLGKGPSMYEGMLASKNEVIVFLDADIETYQENTIELLTEPILSNQVDFVKSYFTRQAGRVTELVAKPLLNILYPSFPELKQPLSGMIAGKKSLFKKCVFEEGYGVDIGLVIDMYALNARVAEVNIGHIENRMQSLDQLGKMSREVAKTIIDKSKNNKIQTLETFENISVIREQMDFAIRESLGALKKLAIFDMDNTVLRESFIQRASKKFGFHKELIEVVTKYDNPFTRTKQIAKLMKGISIVEIWNLVEEIPVTKNLKNLIKDLKDKGYIIGIISDSYDCVTNHIKNLYGFDFTLANELEFSKSKATGEVKIPSFFLHDHQSLCNHMYCKLNAMTHMLGRYNIELKNSLVIGDGENDICIIKHSGVGVSFCATASLVDHVADYIIKEPDFNFVADILN